MDSPVLPCIPIPRPAPEVAIALAIDALLLLARSADAYQRDGLTAHWSIDAVQQLGGADAVSAALAALEVRP